MHGGGSDILAMGSRKVGTDGGFALTGFLAVPPIVVQRLPGFPHLSMHVDLDMAPLVALGLLLILSVPLETRLADAFALDLMMTSWANSIEWKMDTYTQQTSDY